MLSPSHTHGCSLYQKCCILLNRTWHHYCAFQIASLVLNCVFVGSMHSDTAGWGLSCWGRQHVSTLQCCCSHTPCPCHSRPALQFHWSSWSSKSQRGRCRLHHCRSLQGPIDCTMQEVIIYLGSYCKQCLYLTHNSHLVTNIQQKQLPFVTSTFTMQTITMQNMSLTWST